MLGAEFVVDDHADHLQVGFDHRADLGDDAGHVNATGLEVAAARVEDGFEFFHQEGDVAAFAEHGGHDAGDGDDPLEVVHVLRVDEDLEGAARFVGGAFVEHDVVDGDVQGVFEQRRFDFVGGADQHVGALDLLVHLDDFGARAGGGCFHDRGGGLSGFAGFVIGALHAVVLDFFADFDGHVGSLRVSR